MTLTAQARAILEDLVMHARNAANREHGSALASMARNARRDGMADVAEIERQVNRTWGAKCPQ